MNLELQPGTTARLDPRLIDIATRRAHELRRQAIDDALHRLGRWLSLPFVQPPRRRFSPGPAARSAPRAPGTAARPG